ncbi:hypothetical protein [Pseudomonas sp. MPC6]|uniref:hypothetical protein n=1 Tax=unclassified Pseudomonas TaxID=196821 RepID=UPI0011107D3D|nr:hypothetical protein [Pseudomonas sp. MPC6]QCY09368.1 hypothetical protein ELQ88_00405 [Pseudomonas sp. MPC6]
MTFKLTALSLAACCLMVGCDKPNTDHAAPADSSGPSSLLNSPKVSSTPQSNRPRAVQAPSSADTSVSLNEYVDLNTLPGGQALTYLVLAKSASSTTSEQKLSWLSPEYQATSDAFKRQDIEKAKWPAIQAQLNGYAKNDYYSLPIKGSSVSEGMGMQNVMVGSYDFASSTFPITSYGQYCWANPVRNNVGMNLQIQPSQFPCSIKIADQNQAREIEQARAQGTLDLRGTLYLYIPKSSGMTAAGEVVHGVIELRDRQSSKVLTTVNL